MENPITSAQLGQLIDMVQDGTITGTSGKYLLRHLLSNPSAKSTKEVAEELQLLAFATPSTEKPSGSTDATTSTNSTEIDVLVQKAITALPKEVAAFREGHKGVANKIVGWIMRQSRGRADAHQVKEKLEQALKE